METRQPFTEPADEGKSEIRSCSEDPGSPGHEPDDDCLSSILDSMESFNGGELSMLRSYGRVKLPERISRPRASGTEVCRVDVVCSAISFP